MTRCAIWGKSKQIGRQAARRQPTDGESTQPLPLPRGLALHLIWAGLLACLQSSPAAFPCASTVAFCGVVRLTAAGAAPDCLKDQSHRLPVSPAPRSWSKAPKQRELYYGGRHPATGRNLARTVPPLCYGTARTASVSPGLRSILLTSSACISSSTIRSRAYSSSRMFFPATISSSL